MSKINTTLIKKGFKSIFKTKLFAILMFMIMLIAGSVYTMLESSSNSLTNSYNYVITNGKLADSLIKVNFAPSSSAELKIGVTDQAGIIYEDINEENIKKSSSTKPSLDGEMWTLDLIVAKATEDYLLYDKQIRQISFINNLDGDFNRELEIVQKEAKSFANEIKNLTNVNLSRTFTNTLNREFANDLVAKNTETLSVSSSYQAYKMVDLGDEKEQEMPINQMMIYDGTNLFTSITSSDTLIEQLKFKLAIAGYDEEDFSFNILKGYKASAVDKTGSSISVVDPSSYEAIVSPSYANANHKASISHQQLQIILENEQGKLENLNSENKEYLNNRYGKSLIWVDQTPYFIIGIGTTPDFAYPIIDGEHNAIDVRNQAVVFVNKRGYERIFDAFRTNPQENYIAVKYDENLTSKEKEELEALITKRATNGGIYNDALGNSYFYPSNQFPANIDIVTSIDEEGDQILLTQERVAFLGELRQTIKTLSYATTSLLVIFLSAVVLMVFNVLVSINKKTYATMIALGYSRTKVALTNALSALILIALPSIFGYLIGFSLQYLFTGIFNNYWTIPVYGETFSILSFVLVAIVPLIFAGFLIASVTYFQLRHPIPEMLNESTDVGLSLFSRWVSKMRGIGLMGKYAAGLTVKNLGKLLLLLVTAIIAISAIMVGIGSLGKAELAYNRTINFTNYKFEIELYSPTLEGGQYYNLQVDDLEQKTNEPIEESYDDSGNPQFGPNEIHWHKPSEGDLIYGMPNQIDLKNEEHLKNAANYLKNKLQTKVLLDDDSLGLNPWTIAERLMPENQKNIANQDAEKTMALGGDLNWSVQRKLQERFNQKDMPYILSYNNIITDDNDELFTYIDALILNSGGQEYTIKGVNENTKMLNIDHNILHNMNQSKADLPVLVNHFLAEKYDLKEGDTFEIVVQNALDRNFVNAKNNVFTATVYQIVDGYDQNGFYTTQEIANHIVGYDQLNLDQSRGEQAFNGVFSENENPSLLNTLPLYSPSGIYIGADGIYGDWSNVMNAILANDSIWPYQKEITRDLDRFNQIYSTTPYVSATSLVNWKEINKLTFENVSTLSSTIILIIEIISIILSIVFTIIVASLLLVANRKKIATLWTLGYRKREILRVFLTMYIFPLVLATIISLPIAYGILAALRLFVMNFGSILIPFALTWWIPFVAVGLVALIFVLSTVITIYTQKQADALSAFKGD